jgi:hypothetical protein
MYLDTKIEPNAKYYYRVCALDAAGQKGPFSGEAQAVTKAPDPVETLSKGITAQSVYAPQYGAEQAIDDCNDPYSAWIAIPYGGGTKEKPQDVWWAFEFPAGKKLALSGVKLIGDHREEIPLQKNLLVQARVNGQWKTVGQATDAATKDIVVKWPEAIETDAIRWVYEAAIEYHELDAQPGRMTRMAKALEAAGFHIHVTPAHDGTRVGLIRARRK